jgi:hypothetical protein
MTGNLSRPLAMVIDNNRGCMWAGIDIFRPAL